MKIVSDLCGLPGFGEAMASVGWVVEQSDGSVSFPKFFKDNESPEDRHKRQAAERQARHREKLALEKESDQAVKSNVTSNVTITHREEKRRLKKNTSDEPTRFIEFWRVYPRHEAKAEALKIWVKRKLDHVADAILMDVKRHIDAGDWKERQFTPMPKTYLHGERWTDDEERSVSSTNPEWMEGVR